MATNYWIGNAATVAQVNTITITAVANAGTLTVTINTKSITYTCTGADTTTTAAAALQALLAACQFPEFLEVTWGNTGGATILVTCNTPGLPFTLTVAGAGGSTLTNAITTNNISPNDANYPDNWSQGVPVSTQDIIIANSAVSLLYGLSALLAITANSITIWNSFTGSLGLLENNPAGYVEYRPTYWQISATTLIVGIGSTGNGSGLMRINVGSVQTAVTVLTTGSAATGTPYALRLLGTHVSNTLKVAGGTVGVGMLPAETSDFATVIVTAGGSLDMGTGVTATTCTCTAGTMNIRGATTTVTFTGGTGLLGNSSGFTTVTIQSGASVTWTNTGTITTLVVSGASQVDCSTDPRPRTATTATFSGDSSVNDPNNTVTWTNAITLSTNITTGPFVLGPGRTFTIV